MKRDAPEPGRRPPVARLRLSESSHWYDGARKRTCWRNPELVVDFENGDAPPDAEEVFATDVVHVYRVRKIPGGRFVRVYHDGPSDRGLMRAPTGRIIVKFKPDWTAPAITTWAVQEGLGDARKLDFGKNLWAFRGGADAIAKATGYHESGRFVWVSPDWWKSASKR